MNHTLSYRNYQKRRLHCKVQNLTAPISESMDRTEKQLYSKAITQEHIRYLDLEYERKISLQTAYKERRTSIFDAFNVVELHNPITRASVITALHNVSK